MSGGAIPGPDELVAQLIRVAEDILERYDASAAFVGLSAQEARLLFILGVKPANMLGLTQALRVPKSTMTGLVARMERQGLVTRDRDASDRRHLVTNPTELGTAVSHRFERDLADRVSSALDGFDGAERQELAELLTEVLVRIEPAQP